MTCPAESFVLPPSKKNGNETLHGDRRRTAGVVPSSSLSFSSSSSSSSSSLKVKQEEITTAVDGTNTSSTSSTPSYFSGCFFPNHKALQGDVAAMVVKYARRRLQKAQLPPPIMDMDPSSLGSSIQSSIVLVPQFSHDDFTLQDLVGEGSFSSVYTVKESTEVVIKVLRCNLLKQPPMLAACAADLIKEGCILAHLQSLSSAPSKKASTTPHPHIVGLRGTARGDGIHAWYGAHDSSSSTTICRHDAYFLVLDKLEATLSDKFKIWRTTFPHKKNKANCGGKFRWWWWSQSQQQQQQQQQHRCDQKWQSFQQRMQLVDPLAQAVAYLHANHILHRDLKPDNIGFDARGVLKVFDLDVARILPGSSSSSSSTENTTFQMTKRVGSPRYMSPECARGDPYNAKSDVYSFTLLVHELYTLDKPYEDIPSELHDQLVFYKARRPKLPKTWPHAWKEWLARSWNPDVTQRPTMAQWQHEWKQRFQPLVLADKQRKYHSKTTTTPWMKTPTNRTTSTITTTTNSSINCKETTPLKTTTTVTEGAEGEEGSSCCDFSLPPGSDLQGQSQFHHQHQQHRRPLG